MADEEEVKIPLQIHRSIIESEAGFKRILQHNEEFKGMFRAICDRLDSFQKALHNEETNRMMADAAIAAGCEKNEKMIYRAGAFGAIGTLVTFTGAVIYFIATYLK